MGRHKLSYVISDGLGPYFLDQLVKDIKTSGWGYTLAYDETSNIQGKKQLDVHVRYWSESSQMVRVSFLKAIMFGHAKADQVSKELLDTLLTAGLPLSSLIALSSDGPNVNKSISKKMSTFSQKNYLLWLTWEHVAYILCITALVVV